MDHKRPDDLRLSYRRVPRTPVGLFAGRFVTFATCGLLAAIALAIVEVDVLLRYVAFNRPTSIDVVFLPALRLSLDGLLFVGCLGVIFRRPQARRTLTAFALGETAEIATTIIIVLIRQSEGQRNQDLLPTFALLAVRGVIARAVRVAAASAHADFYFGVGDRRPDFVLPAISQATPPSPPRFRVRGTDRATGHSATVDSRARTRDAARRSAEHLGFDPDTIVIEPIADDDLAKT